MERKDKPGKAEKRGGRPVQWRSFQEARAFARKLSLPSATAWQSYSRGDFRKTVGLRPADVPSTPNKAYRSAWRGWGDWLGTGNVSTRNHKFRPFLEARAFVRSLKLQGWAEWSRYCRGELPGKGKPPGDIPHSPWKAYKGKGWRRGLSDFIGCVSMRRCQRDHRPFDEARAFARGLGLSGRDAWRAYCCGESKKTKGLRPADVPAAPNLVYRSAWRGWGDWLGTVDLSTHNRQHRPFLEARAFVRSLKLQGWTEWFRYCRGELPGNGKPPSDILHSPWTVYKDKGWSGLPDFLGYEPKQGPRREYLPFDEARAFIRSLKLASITAWWVYSRGESREKGKRPFNIPSAPWRVYKGKGWSGFPDWLGTARSARYQVSGERGQV